MKCTPATWRAVLSAVLLLLLALPAAADDARSGAVSTAASAPAGAGGCGNDREGHGELCDGTDLDGQSCASLGQGTGTLRCSADCRSFDFSGCTGAPFCGNGILELNEACDTAGPSPFCDWDCTPSMCGDGVINPLADEQCDDGNAQNGDGCSMTCHFECPTAG